MNSSRMPHDEGREKEASERQFPHWEGGDEATDVLFCRWM